MILNLNFETFGYPTEEGCQICGKKPAKVEPRFNYIVCEKHAVLDPLTVNVLITDRKIQNTINNNL